MSVQVFPSVLREVDNGAGAVPNGKMTRDPRTVEPIERGLVHDWEALESMWRYIFYTNLGWEMGNEGQVLLAEPLGTSKVIRGDGEGMTCWNCGERKSKQYSHGLSDGSLFGGWGGNRAILHEGKAQLTG